MKYFKTIINYNQMKKSSFVMCAMLVALCTVFVSCEKKKKDAPTIKFTYNGVVKNNGEEVDAKVGEEIPIIVEYEAQGKLHQIFLRVIGTAHNEAHSYNFDTKTTHKITKTIDFTEAGETQIKASVEDKQKESLKTNFELKINVK
jgi:hypothetical protein